MPDSTTPRMKQLKEMLQKQPRDAFLLYGMALELKKAQDLQKALEYLQRVIEVDPAYGYAFYQMGQIHEERGEVDSARQSYRDGIEAARRSGDSHAQSELETALTMLE